MSKYIQYFLAFCFAATIFSCKKESPKDIGLPLLPGGDILNASYFDTVTIAAHTVKDDSIRTESATPMLLGNAYDPIFGVTKASLFTQLMQSRVVTNFGSNPILDSAILSLVYNKGQYYGTLYPQKIKVYQVTSPLHIDSIYYSNRMLQYSQELGSAYIRPRPADSIMIDTVKHAPQLKIPLDKNFFQKFLDDTTHYTSILNFQDYFKGLYIASSSGSPYGQGAILYMNMLHTDSRLTLYYHNTKDTSSYYFAVSGNYCAYFTHFEHDYSSSNAIKIQLNTPASIAEDKVYIQSMSGIRTKITFPYLKDLYKNGKIVINKAELILPVDPTSIAGADSIFQPPVNLVLNIADSLRYENVPADYYEGLASFGGTYIPSGKEYKFNISRFIQQILTGKIANQPLYINCYNVRTYTTFQDTRRTTANRVVLMGGNKLLPSHMKLKITYTPVR